ncbi:MAG: DUF167 domain-containing protein [Zavarzinella sp.]
MDLQLVATEHGCRLSVRAQPGAKRNAVVGIHGGALKIAVTAPPTDGKANAALESFLASILEVRPHQVRLVAGATNRNKQFELLQVTVEEALTAISPHLG